MEDYQVMVNKSIADCGVNRNEVLKIRKTRQRRRAQELPGFRRFVLSETISAGNSGRSLRQNIKQNLCTTLCRQTERPLVFDACFDTR